VERTIYTEQPIPTRAVTQSGPPEYSDGARTALEQALARYGTEIMKTPDQILGTIVSLEA
jgi:hypothetical protein